MSGSARSGRTRGLLIDTFKTADADQSGWLPVNFVIELLANVGLPEEIVNKLLDASQSRVSSADGKAGLNYVAFVEWLLDSQAFEVMDAAVDDTTTGMTWVDRCARVLETRSEADFVQKKLVKAQVQAHLRNWKERTTKFAPPKRGRSGGTSRRRKVPCDAQNSTPLPDLQWDGPTLMQNIVDEGPDVLTCEHVCQVLDAAAQILPIRHPKPVVHLPVPEGGRVVVVGDTHGQVKDILLIFLLYGMPSSTNAYVINGDVADRGPDASAIFILILLFLLGEEGCLVLNRGNHEDDLMNYMSSDQGGGFYDECVLKYGETTYRKFVDIFKLLPLATVVHDEVFIVHGGLPRGPIASLSVLDSINHTAVCCPAPDCESAQDLIFTDLLWSDPMESPGQQPSRRGAGTYWGPDVTKEFLAKNHLRWIIRSHELPYCDRGWMEHHFGLVFTVFSASNYWGHELNWGAVALLTCTDEGHVQQTLREHNVPDLDEVRRLSRFPEGSEREVAATQCGFSWIDNDRVAVGKRRVELSLRRLAGIVIEFKPSLFQQFHCHDPDNTGVISRDIWLDCIRLVCGDYLPWEIATEHWAPADAEHVDYRQFLDRFKVVLSQDRWCSWKPLVIADVYLELLRRNEAAHDTIQTFDPSGDGIVSSEEFMELVSELTGESLSQPQVSALSRTVFTHAQGDGLRAEEFLSRFSVAFVQSKAMIGSDGKDRLASYGSTIEHLGKLIIRSLPDDQRTKTALSSSFKKFDDSNDGYLQVEEFVKHVSSLAGFEKVRHNGEPLDDQCLRDIAQTIADSYSHDGMINLLEFAQAFAVVDASGSTDLADDVSEHILTYLYRHRYALQAGCQEYDVASEGIVEKGDFCSVLEATNLVTARPERHLTKAQIDCLVESIAGDNGLVEYRAFLNSFEVIIC